MHFRDDALRHRVARQFHSQTHRAEIDAVLDRNKREASALAPQGTSAFIINGNLIPGGMPLAQLQAVIARIRAGEPLR